MAKGFNVSVDMGGVSEKLRGIPQIVVKEVSAVMENTAKEFVARAKRDAPVDTGFLKGQIGYLKLDTLSFQVISGAFQAGFIEFGTKRNYRAIPGFEAEAASIKGIKGGTAEEMLENIKQWVKRKGIRFESAGTYKSGAKAGRNRQLSLEDTAYIIYHFILLNGIKPQPYFFKQVEPARKQLQADLNAIVID